MLPFDMIFSAVGAAGKMEGASLSLKDGTADGQGGGQFSSVLNAAIDPDADLTWENGELPLDVPYELFGLQAQPLPVRFAFAAGLSLTGAGDGQVQDIALAPQLSDAGPEGGDVPILAPNGKGASDLLQGAGVPLAPTGATATPDGELLAGAGKAALGAGDLLQPAPLSADRPASTTANAFSEASPLNLNVNGLAAIRETATPVAPVSGNLQTVEASGAGNTPATTSGQSQISQQVVAASLALQGQKPAGEQVPENAFAADKLQGNGAHLGQEVQGQGNGLGVTAKKWQSGLPQELRASVASLVVGQTPAAAKLVETPAAVQPTVLTSPVQDVDVASNLPLATPAEDVLAPVLDEAAGELGAVVKAAAGNTTAQQGQAGGAPAVIASSEDGAVSPDQAVQVKVAQQDKGGLPPADLENAPVADAGEGDVDAGEQPIVASSAKKQGAASSAATPRETIVSQQSAAKTDAVAVAAQQPLSGPEGELEFELEPDALLRMSGAGGDAVSVSRADTSVRPGQVLSSHVAMQVAGEIARNLQNGNTRFQMRFDPPELGRVDVKMKVSADGSVQAHLIVERPETLDMFMRDQRGLERALEAAGLTADSENMKFSLKDQGSSGFQFSEGRDQPQERGSDRSGAGRELALEDEEFGPGVRMNLTARAGGLDVRI